jgi:hypothetical protein
VVAVTTGLVAAGAPSRAFAQPTSAIDPEVIYRSALDDMKAGRYPEACPKFAEARRLQPDSRSALQGLALCYDKSGKTASAWAKYRQLSVELKSGGDSAKAEAAAARAEELGKALSTLKVSPAGSETPGLVIRLDKEEVPRAMFGAAMNVDPGSHVLEATAPGYEVWQTTVTVGAANDAKELKVPSLVAKPSGSSSGDASGPSPALRPAAYALGGVGAAGVVLGAVFGGLAVGAASTVKSECPGNVCPSSHQSDLNAANTKALVSTVGLVAGGALLATGVVLFVVSRPSAKKDDAPAAAALVPSVGPGGGGLSMIGRF